MSPSLTPDDQKRMLGPVENYKCPKCKEEKYRGYCRECDEFYFTCGCKTKADSGHDHHRTY